MINNEYSKIKSIISRDGAEHSRDQTFSPSNVEQIVFIKLIQLKGNLLFNNDTNVALQTVKMLLVQEQAGTVISVKMVRYLLSHPFSSISSGGKFKVKKLRTHCLKLCPKDKKSLKRIKFCAS